jgi:predicted DNA-binding transcriptional regulator AlpA
MSAIKKTKAESSRLINAKDVGKRLGLSQQQVRRLAAAGTLPTPTCVAGASKRWKVTDIKAWNAAGRPNNNMTARYQCATARAVSPGETVRTEGLSPPSGWYSKLKPGARS